MDDDPSRRPRKPTTHEYTGQQSDSAEEPEPRPPADRAGSIPVGFDDERPADPEHYDSEHFEPL